MSKEKPPITPAVRALRAVKVDFACHLYRYAEGGGTAVAARELGVEETSVIKTLVMETDQRQPLLVLMHGDREVSVRKLARQLGERGITPCQPQAATHHTGYLVGGISPFGTRHPLPIYYERSIEALPRLYINGGKRGFLVSLAPIDLMRVLQPTAVEVAR